MKKFNVIGFFFVLAIILFAFFLRIYDINWDQGTHIHPDERFLTMVGVAMKIPNSFTAYLDPHISLLNPANVNFSFFVYGIFPLVLTKIYAVLFQFDSYDKFNLLGRGLSALFDTFTVIIVIKLSFLFKRKYHLSTFFPYLSGFLYAIAVFPIQQSHFFTVDTFANFFALAAFAFAVDYWDKKKNISFIISAIFFGISLSCKITSFYILPLIALYLFLGLYEKYHTIFSVRNILKTPVIPFLLAFVVFGVLSYVSMRITDPYIFETGNFFLPALNKNFLANLQTLKSYDNPAIWYPPGVQWIHKTPILFGVKNLSLYGIGIIYTFFVLFGVGIIAMRYRKTLLFVCMLWAVGIALFQGVQYVQAMRYYFIIYPFLAVLAALGASYIIKHRASLLILFLILVSIWTTAFFSIYTKPLSRVTASLWFDNTVAVSNIVLGESWDDPLPLPIPDMPSKPYAIQMLPVFDPDTAGKWSTIYTALNKSNYLILSSNRGWGSMSTVPEKYPLMTKFYNDLFAGKLAYKQVAIFTSYPSLTYLGIPLTFPDDNADESFTVYDHPKVLIFKKTIQ